MTIHGTGGLKCHQSESIKYKNFQGIHHTSRTIKDEYKLEKMPESSAILLHFNQIRPSKFIFLDTIRQRYGKRLTKACKKPLEVINESC